MRRLLIRYGFSVCIAAVGVALVWHGSNGWVVLGVLAMFSAHNWEKHL